jgi:hypothetical protein
MCKRFFVSLCDRKFVIHAYAGEIMERGRCYKRFSALRVIETKSRLFLKLRPVDYAFNRSGII